jgi:uncharacterized protein YdhG (YjbR/CyaY superfamily)
MKSNAGTVSAYLESLPMEHRKALETLRAMIERVAPQAKGSMKIGLPSWELNGPLFALASRQHGMELYVAYADLVAKRKKTLGNAEIGTTSIRFKRIDDLDLRVVEALLVEAADRRKGGPTAPRS